MEAILESIKKVIARDNRETALAERRRIEGDGASPVNERLFRLVHPTANEGAAFSDEVLDLGAQDAEMVDDRPQSGPRLLLKDPVPEPVIEAESSFTADEVALHEDDLTPIVSERATAAVLRSLAEMESLASLAPAAEPAAAAEPVTLEGLVREMLRPMLAEWIEANLPAIVERTVKTEFERIIRTRR